MEWENSPHLAMKLSISQSSDYFKLLKIEDDALKMAAILKQLRLNVC